jgi:hypothetical protein
VVKRTRLTLTFICILPLLLLLAAAVVVVVVIVVIQKGHCAELNSASGMSRRYINVHFESFFALGRDGGKFWTSRTSDTSQNTG